MNKVLSSKILGNCHKKNALTVSMGEVSQYFCRIEMVIYFFIAATSLV